MHSPVTTARRLAALFGGFLLLSLGIDLIIKGSPWGVGPWDVLHLGLLNYLPVSLGQVNIITGVAIVFIGYLLGVKPTWVTILNILSIGFLVDLFFRYLISPEPMGGVAGILSICGGTVVLGMGAALYISADMGAGPRDTLMLALQSLTGWRISLVRSGLELTVTLTGYLLGGPVGLGTILFAFLIGPVIEFFLRLFRPMVRRARAVGH